MRRWGILAVPFVASLVISSGAAHAQPDSAVAAAGPDAGEPSTLAAPAVRLGYAAMPGGQRVATAQTLAPGTLAFAALSGFGYRKSLLSADHTMDRAIGELAVAFVPLRDLTIGLSLDGRYDHHAGFAAMTDDGFVGDPHLLVRFAAPVTASGRVTLGAQGNLWVPGKDAPSIVGAATSVDLRGLLTIETGAGLVSGNAGFRIDNSAQSIDHPERLSVEDQVSLGVSRYHAATAGLAFLAPIGARMYVDLEASTDVFVGAGAPDPIFRGGATFGVELTGALTLLAFVEAAKVPGILYSAARADHVPLVPYEPNITGGLGLQARFGTAARPAPRGSAGGDVVVNARPADVAVVETADVSGIVFDDAGKPVVAANVTVRLKNHTATAVTDGRGAYTIARLPIGQTVGGKTTLDDTAAEVTAELPSRKPAVTTLTLAKGANAAPPLSLEPTLPPGQLKGVIRNVASGRPIGNATVTIEPGGTTATSSSDGQFSIDLPPGHYTITVTAKGLAQQKLDVDIPKNSVAIKNIDLRK
ncbi:MAG TPA: carboxypeptidase-like regulatory domain-containing protein [Kofleriaceae bacterium]|nr:carboxypeptidase-like regulatory domain-containing protein [Kofleriaceae bacterium]